jgi:hypothetical protein
MTTFSFFVRSINFGRGSFFAFSTALISFLLAPPAVLHSNEKKSSVFPSLAGRVTGLGDFSPVGWLFILSVCLLFSKVQVMRSF